MNNVTYHLSSTDISIFLLEIRKVRYIKKNRYRFHLDTQLLTLLTFLESLRIVSITVMIPEVLMVLVKMGIPGLPKMKVFWKKGYDIIISTLDVTKKFMSRDPNYYANLFMWPKFGNSSISVREVVITLSL